MKLAVSDVPVPILICSYSALSIGATASHASFVISHNSVSGLSLAIAIPSLDLDEDGEYLGAKAWATPKMTKRTLRTVIPCIV